MELNNKKALSNFNEQLIKFPESKYAKDSRQKIILVNEIVAAKHMDIGLLLFKKIKNIQQLLIDTI